MVGRRTREVCLVGGCSKPASGRSLRTATPISSSAKSSIADERLLAVIEVLERAPRACHTRGTCSSASRARAPRAPPASPRAQPLDSSCCSRPALELPMSGAFLAAHVGRHLGAGVHQNPPVQVRRPACIRGASVFGPSRGDRSAGALAPRPRRSAPQVVRSSQRRRPRGGPPHAGAVAGVKVRARVARTSTWEM